MSVQDPNADLPPMSLRDAYIALWRRRTTIWGYLVTVAAGVAVKYPASAEWILLLVGPSTAALGHYNASQLKKQPGGPTS